MRALTLSVESARDGQGGLGWMIARRPISMHVHDRFAQSDVVNAVCRRCRRRAAAGGAFVEMDQFLLEALLERRDLIGSPGPAGGRRAAFRAQDRGRASQEW